MKTTLKIGDDVTLLDEEFYSRDPAQNARAFTAKGPGYKVTAITERFIECTNEAKDGADRTCFYGENNLHYIEPTKVRS